MAWIKNIVVDMVATALIMSASVLDISWARWIMLVYTPFMLVLKVAALFLGGFMPIAKRATGPQPPDAVLHGLYALNVIVPLACQWWLVGIGWALIWALSVTADLKAKPRLKTTS
jgi:hypothetical protein